MVYKDLHIEHFKGIKELKMEGFAPINVLVGKNNCGKSSVLEALYLMTPNMIDRWLNFNVHDVLNNFNSETEKRDGLSFFYNRDTSTNPKLWTGIYNSLNSQQLSINIDKEYVDVFNVIIDAYHDESRLTSIIQKYDLYNKKSNSTPTTQSRIAVDNFPSYRNSYLWGHHSLFGERKKYILNQELDRIPDIVKVLQELDPIIIDVRFGMDNSLFIITNEGVRLPLSYFGDGIKRALFILAAVSYCRDGILLIDEVDTGLHYTALKTLWKAILIGAKEFNVQVFVTTHSDECVDTLNEVFREQEESDSEEGYALFRIEKHEDSHRAVRFAPKNHDFFLTRNWEYR